MARPPADEPAPRVARRYRVVGRVQGVGFRHFTLLLARRAGVSGWVRNSPDGEVEIEAAGRADQLRRFEEELRRGPTGARVDRVDAVDLTTTPAFDGFQVRA